MIVEPMAYLFQRPSYHRRFGCGSGRSPTLPEGLVFKVRATLPSHCSIAWRIGVERAIVDVHRWPTRSRRASPSGAQRIPGSRQAIRKLLDRRRIGARLPLIGDDPFLICDTDAFSIEPR